MYFLQIIVFFAKTMLQRQEKPCILSVENNGMIFCLRGGVQVPTGGIVRERRDRRRNRRNSGTDSNSLDERRRIRRGIHAPFLLDTL